MLFRDFEGPQVPSRLTLTRELQSVLDMHRQSLESLAVRFYPSAKWLGMSHSATTSLKHWLEDRIPIRETCQLARLPSIGMGGYSRRIIERLQ